MLKVWQNTAAYETLSLSFGQHRLHTWDNGFKLSRKLLQQEEEEAELTFKHVSSWCLPAALLDLASPASPNSVERRANGHETARHNHASDTSLERAMACPKPHSLPEGKATEVGHLDRKMRATEGEKVEKEARVQCSALTQRRNVLHAYVKK